MNKGNLAKLGDGLDESPTVMVGEAATIRQLGKNRGILNPSWAFVETNITSPASICYYTEKPQSSQP